MRARSARKHQYIPHFRVQHAQQLAILLGLSCGLSACDSCSSQKPYTPFGVASGVSGAEQAPSPPPEPSSAAPASSAGFAVRKAVLVPGVASTWSGSELNLKAPDKRRFVQVLPSDFDGDSKLDALAWLAPTAADKNAPPGELWYFPNGAPAHKLSALPGFVPSSPDCTLETTLSQTGPHSATLDVSATCNAQLIARAPVRALVVVSPSVEHPLLLTLRAASAAPGETLNFSIDSSDQDHDGRDDVRLTLSIGAGASDTASAELAWLDRAAGASRSSSEPGSSLLRAAGKVALLARSKRGEKTGERVGNVLRLMSSVCAEGGVARVFDEDGVPFRCGDPSKVLDSLTLSEALGALAQSDTLAAFSVLRKDGWYFGKLSSNGRKAVERELLRAVTRFEADAPLAVRALPALVPLVHYSPLWFESDGALLVQSPGGGVSRLNADRGAEEAVSAEAGVPSWPLEVVTPSGQRLLGAIHACDRSELSFNTSDAQHPLLPPLATRVLAARPASCAGHGTGPNVAFSPLSFDDNGLEALIAGARVSVASPGKKPAPGLPALGTPRSPDGHWLVAPSPLGLLVVGDRKELWQTEKLAEHADATRLVDCVVANDARAVACIDSGRVVLFEHPKQPASATHKK
ncbi:MAG: hypothetical protein ABW061_04415 [Polyangiaceae bacterium]